MTTKELVALLKAQENFGVYPAPVSAVVELLEVDNEHKLEFVNAMFGGIHLKMGEVVEVPVILRITGTRN
jgi:hypothetical protein